MSRKYQQQRIEDFSEGNHELEESITLSLRVNLEKDGMLAYKIERNMHRQDYTLLVWWSKEAGGNPTDPQLNTSFRHLSAPQEIIVVRDYTKEDNSITDLATLDKKMGTGDLFLNIQNLSGNDNSFVIGIETSEL